MTLGRFFADLFVAGAGVCLVRAWVTGGERRCMGLLAMSWGVRCAGAASGWAAWGGWAGEVGWRAVGWGSVVRAAMGASLSAV